MITNLTREQKLANMTMRTRRLFDEETLLFTWMDGPSWRWMLGAETAVGSKQSLSPPSIFVPNFCSILMIRQKIKRSKCCFIPVISFKIGYVKHWFSQNFAQSISKMATEYTLENWGLESLIDSRKLIFVSPMAVKKFADVKCTPC